jgi:hypothetical protein
LEFTRQVVELILMKHGGGVNEGGRPSVGEVSPPPPADPRNPRRYDLAAHLIEATKIR